MNQSVSSAAKGIICGRYHVPTQLLPRRGRGQEVRRVLTLNSAISDATKKYFSGFSCTGNFERRGTKKNPYSTG